MTAEVCQKCGKEHDAPFSVEVFSLARRILELGSDGERHALLMELVDLYSDEIDCADLSLPEELHCMLEDYLRAKTEVAASAFRLGRYLLRAVGAYDHHRNALNEEMPDPDKKPSVKKAVGLN